MNTLSVPVLAALLLVDWCSAQSSVVPTPRPFERPFPSRGSSNPSSFGGSSFDTSRPSFGTSRPSFGTSRPSFNDGSIFTNDPNQISFPGSSSSDGFLNTGQPGAFGTQSFFPGGSSSGVFRPSTGAFGTPGTNNFVSPGGFFGQPVVLTPGNVVLGAPNTLTGQGFGTPSTFTGQGFGTPTTFTGQGFGTPTTFTGHGFGSPTTFTGQGFGTPVTFGSSIPRHGGTTFNTGLGSNTGTNSFPGNTQFGALNPSSFGSAIPVFVNQGGVPLTGFQQGGLPVSAFSQGGVPITSLNQGNVPVILSQSGFPGQGFFQTPNGFIQTPTGGSFGQNRLPVNSFGQSGVPFGVNQNSVNGFPSSANIPLSFPPPPTSSQNSGVFGSSDDNNRRPGLRSSGSTSSGSSNTPSIRRPSFLRSKSGPSKSASSPSVTETEKN